MGHSGRSCWNVQSCDRNSPSELLEFAAGDDLILIVALTLHIFQLAARLLSCQCRAEADGHASVSKELLGISSIQIHGYQFQVDCTHDNELDFVGLVHLVRIS